MIIHDWIEKDDVLEIDGDEISTKYSDQTFVMDAINASTCARFENFLRYDGISETRSCDEVIYASDHDGNTLMINYGKNEDQRGVWVNIIVNDEPHRHTNIYFLEGHPTETYNTDDIEIKDDNFYPYNMEEIENELDGKVPSKSIMTMLCSFFKRR